MEHPTPTPRPRRRRTTLWAAALASAAVLLFGACGDEESAGPEEGATVEDLTESNDNFMERPSDFLGETVSVSAEVAEVLDANTFSIAGEGFGDEGLYVIRAEGPAVDDDDVVEVTGTVREVNVDAFVEDFGFGPQVDRYQPLQGELAIAATAVTVLDEGDNQIGSTTTSSA